MHATPRPRRDAEPPSSVPVSGPATRRAATLASVVALALPLAVGAAAQADPGKGNGNGPPGTPPGQATKQEQAVQPAPAAPEPARPAKPAKPTKPAAPRSNPRGREKRSDSAGGQPKPVAPKVSRGGPRQQAAPAGKPVQAGGNQARGGGKDKARGGGKDKARGRGKDKARGGQRGGGQAKMTICHATGSATNPFVEITIAMPAVAAHARHQDGRDIIPAPAEGCPVAPGAAVKPPGLPPGAPVAPAPAPGAPAPAAVAPVAPPAAVAPAVGAPAPAAPIAGEVLGAFDEQPEAAREEIAAAAPVAEVREAGAEAGRGGLPFTGVDLWVLAVAGAAALLAGVAARRAQTRGDS